MYGQESSGIKDTSSPHQSYKLAIRNPTIPEILPLKFLGSSNPLFKLWTLFLIPSAKKPPLLPIIQNWPLCNYKKDFTRSYSAFFSLSWDFYTCILKHQTTHQVSLTNHIFPKNNQKCYFSWKYLPFFVLLSDYFYSKGILGGLI